MENEMFSIRELKENILYTSEIDSQFDDNTKMQILCVVSKIQILGFDVKVVLFVDLKIGMFGTLLKHTNHDDKLNEKTFKKIHDFDVTETKNYCENSFVLQQFSEQVMNMLNSGDIEGFKEITGSFKPEDFNNVNEHQQFIMVRNQQISMKSSKKETPFKLTIKHKNDQLPN